jgi:hypothetical protein
MKFPYLLLLFFTSVFAFSAQGVHLSGMVTDSVSGSRINGASVSAAGDQAQGPSVTDVNGVFILLLREDIKPGEVVTIRVQKKGYQPHEENVGVAPTLPKPIQLVPITLPSKPKPKPQKLVHIEFKDAPELTKRRQQIITQDVSGMHDYFVSLEVPTPGTLPPFTVTGGFGTFTPKPQYRGELIIPRANVSDRKIATFIYTAYVIQEAVPDKDEGFYKFDGPDFATHVWLRDFFSSALRDYFQGSYWNKFESQEPWSIILWKIRTSLGKSFTDRLASYVLRILADTPQELVDPDLNVSFAKALRAADGILEANQQSWPKIQDILDHNKVKIELEDKTTRPAHD